ncbi:hypothetical protein GCM10008106_21510 [Mongoliitalea lutea]|uniref:Uncharacterized protein n=1 Tax=Mongoliitalea lutea TaxID=849756 RepID=A0A8J3CXG5_9BACT|nr:hypothetical protein GCM10008106_21510 [Mongoliitalea lutea]
MEGLFFEALGWELRMKNELEKLLGLDNEISFREIKLIYGSAYGRQIRRNIRKGL